MASFSWKNETLALYEHLSFEAQKIYPFHDGWSTACFVILLLFITAVVSLMLLAFLYEAFNCCCCIKDLYVKDMENQPNPVRALLSTMKERKGTEVV
uniref:Small integral membrane protein 18 n=1 Tax=Geotrypetes seraphini TaxID=260995 RepID=A0A6P8P9F6_GEOSA|nr:small integral membrane protein 18 [Geotrypetes seraphini]XP_033785744.1 small integral membrane protein 18-like [Geotrypetes seraphini]